MNLYTVIHRKVEHFTAEAKRQNLDAVISDEAKQAIMKAVLADPEVQQALKAFEQSLLAIPANITFEIVGDMVIDKAGKPIVNGARKLVLKAGDQIKKTFNLDKDGNAIDPSTGKVAINASTLSQLNISGTSGGADGVSPDNTQSSDNPTTEEQKRPSETQLEQTIARTERERKQRYTEWKKDTQASIANRIDLIASGGKDGNPVPSSMDDSFKDMLRKGELGNQALKNDGSDRAITANDHLTQQYAKPDESVRLKNEFVRQFLSDSVFNLDALSGADFSRQNAGFNKLWAALEAKNKSAPSKVFFEALESPNAMRALVTDALLPQAGHTAFGKRVASEYRNVLAEETKGYSATQLLSVLSSPAMQRNILLEAAARALAT
ncbi:MAG: hypothetical protein ACRDAM_10780, partial [Casimicrobium sp.]